MEQKSTIPLSVEEAVERLDSLLTPEDKEYILENGPVGVHFTLGRYIRNEWGLWSDDNSPLVAELKQNGYQHPDDMSNYILEEYLKKLKGKIHD